MKLKDKASSQPQVATNLCFLEKEYPIFKIRLKDK